MANETAPPSQRSNAYNIFILVLTVLSLVIMGTSKPVRMRCGIRS
jgi:hypothetical protein